MSSPDEKLLTSLAIMQVNWDQGHHSHLDNFTPFAVDAMRTSGRAQLSESEVRDAITREFGFVLPLNIVGTILRRSAAAGYCARNASGQFTIITSAAARIALSEQREHCLRQQRNLCESLSAFAVAHHSVSWSPEDAQVALLDYVESNAAALLGTALRGDGVPTVDNSGSERIIVASWIQKINEVDPTRFEYLVTLVKGSMLTTGLLLPNSSEMTRPFRDTALVLDTPVLLKALGYEGLEVRQAYAETLTLAQSQQAKLVCLQRTVVELRRVMNAAANAVGRAPVGVQRPIDRHFADVSVTRAQIMTMMERLEDDLGRLGIEVRDRPPIRSRFVVDETALQEQLENEVHGDASRHEAMLHDLQALTAVHEMRRDRDGDRLENCGSVFVTVNGGLVHVAKTFPDFRRHNWPLAMSIDHVATMLWVKTPLAAPDLPRHRLLADCFSALAPAPAVWNLFLTEIDRLRESGDITDADVTFLRYSQEARRELAIASVSEPGELQRDSVQTVIRRVTATLTAPTNALLEDAELELSTSMRREAAEANRAVTAETNLAAALAALDAAQLERDKHENRNRTLRRTIDRQSKLVEKWSGWVLVTATTVGVWWANAELTASGSQAPTILTAIAMVMGNLTRPGRAIATRLSLLYSLVRYRLAHLDIEATPVSGRSEDKAKD